MPAAHHPQRPEQPDLPLTPSPAEVQRLARAGWTFEARTQRLPDGRFVVTPGEPRQRVRTAEAVRITGIPAKTLHRLADAGHIRRATVSANIIFWWPAEIETLIERCAAEEGYAEKVARACDLHRDDLRRVPAVPADHPRLAL